MKNISYGEVISMKKNWKIYALWIVVCEAVGAISGFLSREGIDIYNYTVTKPPLTPPAWVFPVVWGILFALMGIAAARISLTEKSKQRDSALGLFVAQLIVNFFWPLFFFNAQVYGFAFFWLILLWVLVLFTALRFSKMDLPAAWLLAPYLLWLTFAAYLSGGVWLLN